MRWDLRRALVGVVAVVSWGSGLVGDRVGLVSSGSGRSLSFVLAEGGTVVSAVGAGMQVGYVTGATVMG